MTKYVLIESGGKLGHYNRAQIAYRLLSLIDSKWLTMGIAYKIIDIIQTEKE